VAHPLDRLTWAMRLALSPNLLAQTSHIPKTLSEIADDGSSKKIDLSILAETLMWVLNIVI